MVPLKLSSIIAVGGFIAAFPATGVPLAAQHPVEGVEWSVQSLRPHGQAIVPVFEGWYPNADGSYSLSFGYYNMNLEEAADIPIGPDNQVLPSEFDGLQPTRFDPIPVNGARRHWGVFTVRVPADFGRQRVVWSLTHNGKTFAVPGHIEGPSYIIEDLWVPTQGDVAATMRIGDSSLEKRGRDFQGIDDVRPVAARVGQPVPLSVTIDPNAEPKNSRMIEGNLVWWFKHQGPGEVTFSDPEVKVEGAGTASTTATFGAPGEYIVRVQAVENVATLEFHCCWTNGFIRVNVTM